MAKISDIDEISQKLTQLKRATESGYYAPVESIELEYNSKSSELTLILDYPNDKNGEVTFSVPEFWEEGRRLVEVFDILDIDVDNLSELTNRSLPIKRENGKWEFDSTRLDNGQYLEGNSYTEE